MKYLTIKNRRVDFLYKDGSTTVTDKLEKIDSIGIKKLLESAYLDPEFEIDYLEEGDELVNPVEKAIYTHLASKIKDILEKKNDKIEALETLYESAKSKYSSS